MAGRKQSDVTRRVYAYYIARPGELIHYADVARELGYTKEAANAPLVRAVAQYPEMGITREGSAGYYVYRKPSEVPSPKPTQPSLPELWEELGKLGDRILVRNSLNQIKFLSDE